MKLAVWEAASNKAAFIKCSEGNLFPPIFRLSENSLESGLVNIIIKVLVSSSLFCSCWFQSVGKGGMAPSMPQQLLKDPVLAVRDHIK